MAEEEDVVEQLRSRLAHLEARQRATGSTAEPGFWDRVAAAAKEAEGLEQGSGGGPAPRPRTQRPRPLAPASRPPVEVSGPWAGVSPEGVEAADPARLEWSGESEMADPGWVAAVAARADAAYAAELGEPVVPRHPDGPCQAMKPGPTVEPSHPVEPAQVFEPDRLLAPVSAGPPVAVTAEALAGMSLHRHRELELSDAAEWIAAQRASHEVMLVNVVAELESRGTDAPGGLSRVDWLRSLDPTLSAAAARAFVRVGQALPQPKWQHLRVLVTTQQVTVAKAAQIVDFEQRTAPVADPGELTAAVADVVTQAQSLRPEELSLLIRHHAEQIRPPKDDDVLDEGRRQSRGLWFGQPNATGMVAMRGVLDPEAAAVIKSAIDPLSAPSPTTDEHGHTVQPDPRTPARRRADALLEIVARGVAAPDGVATTDKAKVVVLIDHDTLVGQVRGTGRTLSGDVLSAGVVRRMACDAGIIPVVLGGHSEPLDVGRERRLVTKGLRLALITRDRGCSFPGCTIPPAWTDAHHVTHWSRGGHTSLTSTALLCRRHHTHVHRHDLTATVTASQVTWHL